MKPKLTLCLALVLSGILCGSLDVAEGQTNTNVQLAAPALRSVPTNFVAEHFDLIGRRGFRGLEKKAAKGDINAQYQVGARYAEGEGVDENPVKAFEWLQKAANHGNVEAKRRVGEMLISGAGTTTNVNAGLNWLNTAAVQGDVYAQADLGVYYLQGKIVPQDEAKAFHWFLAAAQQGAPAPERSVGAMYANGQGTATNLQAGIEWLLKAAAQHEPQALFDLGHAYFNGLGMTRSTKMAFNYFFKSAMYGQSDGIIEPEAMAILGVQFATGDGVPKDLKFGRKLIESAANDGNAGAQENLGKFFWAEHDYQKAFRWFNRAAHQGLVSSQLLVAYFHFNGLGASTNKVEALKWCCLAAAQGDQHAQITKDELLLNLSASDSKKAIKEAEAFKPVKERPLPLDDSEVTICSMNRHFFIPAKMFGATKHLLVDTGSGLTSISEKYLVELGTSLGQIESSAAFGTNLNLSIYRSPDISIDDRPVDEFWAIGTDLEKISHKMGKPLDGILGMAFLKDHLICFNPGKGEIRIGGPVPGWVKKDAQAIPLKIVPDKINEFSVDARINGMATVHLMVDSGAMETDVSLSEQDWRQIFKNGIINSSSTNSITLGNQVETNRIVKLKSVIIGTNRYTNLTAELVAGTHESSVGQEFIREYVSAIDFPHRVLYLLPSHSMSNP